MALILTDKGLNDEALDMVAAEDLEQLDKWGEQSHDIFQWLAFIMEELGELSEAVSELYFRHGIWENIEKEAIQTATLSLKLAWMARQAARDIQDQQRSMAQLSEYDTAP